MLSLQAAAISETGGQGRGTLPAHADLDMRKKRCWKPTPEVAGGGVIQISSYTHSTVIVKG